MNAAARSYKGTSRFAVRLLPGYEVLSFTAAHLDPRVHGTRLQNAMPLCEFTTPPRRTTRDARKR